LARRLFIGLPREIVEKFVFDDALVKRRVFAAAVLARVVQKKFALTDARSGKSVGLDDVRAGFKEAPVDVADHIRLSERVEVAVVLQVLFRVLETFAADVLLAEAVSADGGAHGAINDDNAFAERFSKEFSVVRHGFKDRKGREKLKLKINES
jgi:hypothetical protein